MVLTASDVASMTRGEHSAYFVGSAIRTGGYRTPATADRLRVRAAA